MTVEGVTQSISDLMLNFGEGDGSKKKPMARPYGVTLLIAGVDAEKGPSLWQVDPSGSFIEWQANAIGGASEGALNMLKKEYFSQLTLKEAEIMALKILKSVMEKKVRNDSHPDRNEQCDHVCGERGQRKTREERC